MKAPASFRLFCYFALFFQLIIPHSCLANEIVFQDDFYGPNPNSTNWEIYDNPGGIVEIINNEELHLSSTYGRNFPYLFLKGATIPNKNYVIDTKIKFSGPLSYGNGVIFSDSLLTNNTKSDLSFNDFIFALWTTSPTTAAAISMLCTTNTPNCSNGTPIILTSVNSSDWTNFKIEEIDDHYKISIGDQTFETVDSSKKISHIWLGNPQETNTNQNWAEIFIDYLYISKPTSVLLTPVIILPGFGGSWDLQAIMSGTPGNNWQVPPQVKAYDNLMNAFKSKGYVEGTNLFLFPFDWRKPLDQLADDLNSFVLSKNFLGKVDLIGHSMGGLVARSYGHKYGLNKVDKIVTAGTPNNGLTDAYGLWEGATFWGDIWWEKALLSLSMELNREPGERKIDTLRRIAPAVKDLLPTNNYLYIQSLLMPWMNMKQVNTYLGNLNANSAQVDSVLILLWSGGELTRDTINIGKRNRLDTLLGLWEDGRPKEKNPFNFSAGDGTVTKNSAVGTFELKGIEGDGNHASIVSTEKSIKTIMEALGISTDGVVGGGYTESSSVFMASLRSPGRLEVCDLELHKCDGALGLYYPIEKLFLLPGYHNEKLRVRVYEAGLGKYTLHLGNVDTKDSWSQIVGRLLKTGQVDTYEIIKGRVDPIEKEDCKKFGWRKYSFVQFRNQGWCEKYVEEHEDKHDED